MNKKPAGEDTLREKAERIAAEKKHEQPELMPPEEMRAALHELHVHQIELEMQNEELRRAQAEIESARERYFNLYDMAPVGYCTLSEKGIILEANLTATALFGMERIDLIGKPISRYIYSEDQDSYYLHKLRLFEKEEPLSFEIRLKRNDGAFFWANINASVMHGADEKRICRITVSDITEHKQAEEQVFFQANLLSSVHDAIIAVDEDLTVSFWNGIAQDITGWTSEEVVGLPAKNLYDQVAIGSPMEEIAQRFHRDDYYMGEVTAKKRNGEVFIADVHIQGITESNGRRKGAIASFRDVTKRREMEETLKESEQRALGLIEELQKADKSKNNFLGVLSHELRNPLATIMAGISLLDITKDEKQVQSAKDIMKRQAAQLCHLVDDLLDLTRISEGRIRLKKECVNLNSIAENIIKDMKGQFAAKRVSIETGLFPEAIYIDADPARITQAAGNLLVNALKFTDSGGRVRITVYRDENMAVIRIEDNGIGISTDVLQRLFKPFSQADDSLARSGGGLGLGLSITKGIAEMHGGKVMAYSAGTGKGAAFEIRLPIIVSEVPKETDTKKQDTNTVRSLNILIVEDNKDFADLLSNMLTAIGHRVNAAYNGRDGLKQTKEFIPDVIFCDIGLPGMDGYEFSKTIRNDTDLKNIKMIALTGYASDHDKKHALASGFNTHLAKPVDLSTLRQVLDQI